MLYFEKLSLIANAKNTGCLPSVTMVSGPARRWTTQQVAMPDARIGTQLARAMISPVTRLIVARRPAQDHWSRLGESELVDAVNRRKY